MADPPPVPRSVTSTSSTSSTFPTNQFSLNPFGSDGNIATTVATVAIASSEQSSPQNRKVESADDGSNSSDLEEGEIVEPRPRPPPHPPINKPSTITSGRRFRRPPPFLPVPTSNRPPRELPFVPPLDLEQSYPQYDYRNIPLEQSPYQQIYPHVSYSSYYPPVQPYQQSYTPEPEPIMHFEHGRKLSNESLIIIEPRYEEASKSLQDILASGISYEDLLAEGMHPIFLDQLFSRIKSKSASSENLALPQTTKSTPPNTYQLPIQQPVPVKAMPQRPDVVAADVDNFLDNLAPSIATPNGGGGDSKKRGYHSAESSFNPPKRRALGLVPPKTLVIDISDDEDDESEDEDSAEDFQEEEEPIIVKPRTFVKIPDRPTLTQKEVGQALRNRELAIEAMKRKIKAKMRSQGTTSQESLAQRIAVSIIDNNEDSPSNTPSAQSPEAIKDPLHLNIDSPNNSTPVPGSKDIRTSASPKPTKELISPVQESTINIVEVITRAVGGGTDTPMNESGGDDDETRLLAELEAECQAEEKARQKRQELENRLASARGKKHPPLNVATTERQGDINKGIIMQDIVRPVEHNDRMMIEIESPLQVVDDEDIAIVQQEGPIFKDDFDMENSTQTKPPKTEVVWFDVVSLIADNDIIKDMADTVIGETPLRQHDEIRKELRSLFKDIGDRSGGDFQALALTVVRVRKSHLENPTHFIKFP